MSAVLIRKKRGESKNRGKEEQNREDQENQQDQEEQEDQDQEPEREQGQEDKGDQVAVKKLLGSIESQGLALFEREVWLMSLLSHQNVVHLFGVTLTPTTSMVMEMLRGGIWFSPRKRSPLFSLFYFRRSL